MPNFAVNLEKNYLIRVKAADADVAERRALEVFERFLSGKQRRGDPEVVVGETHGVDVDPA